MTRLILWTILILVLLRIGWRLVKAVLEGMGYQRQRGASTLGLVRDPVCGTFVMPSRALTSGSGADARYFCSEKCRREYASRDLR